MLFGEIQRCRAEGHVRVHNRHGCRKGNFTAFPVENWEETNEKSLKVQQSQREYLEPEEHWCNTSAFIKQPHDRWGAFPIMLFPLDGCSQQTQHFNIFSDHIHKDTSATTHTLPLSSSSYPSLCLPPFCRSLSLSLNLWSRFFPPLPSLYPCLSFSFCNAT